MLVTILFLQNGNIVVSIEQIWCAGHNTVFTKWKYSCEYRANLVCWSQYCFYNVHVHHTRISCTPHKNILHATPEYTCQNGISVIGVGSRGGEGAVAPLDFWVN